MPFDAQQERTIHEWLTTKHALRSCPSCTSEDWRLHPEIVVAPNLVGGIGGEVDLRNGFGLLIFFCQSCGRVVPFTARHVLGT